MNKLQNLLSDLKKAAQRLKEISIQDGGNIVIRDATIQRFEFTFELAWKCMEEIAQDQNRTISGPRNSIRFAAEIELISNPEAWLKFHEFRNRMVHIYSEKMAQGLYLDIKDFYKLVGPFIQNTEKYLA